MVGSPRRAVDDGAISPMTAAATASSRARDLRCRAVLSLSLSLCLPLPGSLLGRNLSPFLSLCLCGRRPTLICPGLGRRADRRMRPRPRSIDWPLLGGELFSVNKATGNVFNPLSDGGREAKKKKNAGG